MPRIKQLPPEEAQKIAAGEVIERPANVVKELIENALDAGATRITLYIEKAGKKLIRIIDDGCGMDEIDARACFAHHATSKISSVHDLHSINTFGFRGEALSSIASVSHVTLITKTADTDPSIRSATQDEGATKLELSEARILSQEKVSAPNGTDLSIRDILFNVPVRKKFLKTDDTEWRHILHLVHAVALSRRDLHITLYHDGKQVLNCPPVNDYLSRAAQIWDADLAQAMISCSAQERGITIEGMISDHTTYRYDRNALYFFVNGRWIKNYTLSRALMKGYANAIPASQFPTASLMITIDPAEIDVNIHPRKEEVQFLHPKIVEQIIQMAVKTALEARLSAILSKKNAQSIRLQSMHHTDIPPMSSVAFARPPSGASFAQEVPHTKSYAPYNFDAVGQDGFPEEVLSMQPQPKAAPIPDPIPAQTSAVTEDEVSHTVLGVYDKTYIMLSTPTSHEASKGGLNGILFIDQHAAHERILYEQFKARFTDTAIITLMFPQTLTFSRETLDTLEQHLDLLHANGIHCKRQGETALIITATPVYLKNASLKDLVDEMLSNIEACGSTDPESIKKLLQEKIHAKMACAAAVKAGDDLSSEQIQKLLSDFAKTENRSTCPHGRPTSWLLGHDDIVKRFQRDYLSKPTRYT